MQDKIRENAKKWKGQFLTECSQEQEKGKILEVENTIFENIIRDYTIEVNEILKDVKRGEKKRKRRKRRTEN